MSRSAYYDWKRPPGKLISTEELMLWRRIKTLFERSRSSLGSREMMKKLRGEGFKIGRYRVRKLMKKMKLVVRQRIAYRITTNRKFSDAVADNLLNQNFNPTAPNQVWAGDVTYCRTGEGWMYLAIVMDLYSRRIVGWHIDKRMTTGLISKALIKAYSLRRPPAGLVFHSDRGSQYTGRQYRQLLAGYKIRASIDDVGACCDKTQKASLFQADHIY